MTPDDDRDLAELESLPRTAQPPASLENRVIEAMRRHDLIHDPAATPPIGRDRWPRRLALAASLILALSAGWVARGLATPGAPESSSDPPPPERQYLVLLSEPRDLATSKPIGELVGEYRDWAASLAEAGRLVSAARLEHDGIRLTGGAGGEVERHEADWRQTTGYFLIRARSYEEAAALVDDCPHLTYGGEISLRKVANGA